MLLREEGVFGQNSQRGGGGLGQQRQVDVEINAHDPRPGDLFLLCSDGLSGMVEDRILESILVKQSGNLEACAKKLLDTANANGGVDNSTVILARFTLQESITHAQMAGLALALVAIYLLSI